MRKTLLVVILGLWLPALALAAEPLATVETNWDGVLIHLMTVERKGPVLTVKWAAENKASEVRRVSFGFTGSDVCYVLDEENGTKYFVLTDKDRNAVASASNDFLGNGTYGVQTKIEPGKTARFWMKLPAPPPEVKVVSVVFHGVEPIEGVTITDR